MSMSRTPTYTLNAASATTVGVTGGASGAAPLADEGQRAGIAEALLAIEAGLPCAVFRFAAKGFSRRRLCAGGFLDGLGTIERGQA
jgi:hypothetical protein